MGAIYRATRTVVVWLGSATRPMRAALRDADGIFAGEWFAAQAAVARRVGERTDDLSLWRIALIDKFAVGPLLALAWFLDRGWFGRVWTVQECVLARRIVYFVGDRRVPLEDLVRSSEKIELRSTSLEDMFAYSVKQMLRGPRFLLNAREEVRSAGKCTFEAAITENRGRKATDPRDKVFACLAYSSNRLSANYKKTVQQVYAECAAELLRSETGLFVLSPVGQVRHERLLQGYFVRKEWEDIVPNAGLVAGLPSWVPDLSARTVPATLRSLIERPFTACLDQDPSFTIDTSLSVLTLKAAFLRTITNVGESFNFGPFPPGGIYNFQPIWEYLRLPIKLGPVYGPTEESTLSAFWKTLIAGDTAIRTGDGKVVEVNEQRFIEWFVRMAEDGGDLSPADMCRHILRLDERHMWMRTSPRKVWDESKVPRTGLAKDLRRNDVHKFDAVRDFLEALDVPTYGLQRAIRERHETLAQEKRQTDEADPLFRNLFEGYHVDRRLFVADETYLGLAPWTAQKGDIVMVGAGVYVPYVFRPSERAAGGWELIGEAYCHGAMLGEVSEGNLEFKMIDVV